MKKIFVLMIVVIYMVGKSYGQNLVPNGSFEEYYSCPYGLNRVDSCVGWHHYGGVPYLEGTPDYFDSCTAAYSNSVPDNVLGSQVPFEGSAYMGIITFDWSYWYREYIGAKLIDTLMLGNNYAVSMRVSRGDARPIYNLYACVAANKLGIRLTTFPYSQAGESIPENNFAQLYEDSIITDSTNWVLLHWNFIADSAYSYIYIGNFFESNNTDTLRIDCPAVPPLQAYYYIDSVTMTCIDANCATGISDLQKEFFSFFPNPTTTSLNITYTIEHNATLTITNAYGSVVKQLTLYPYFKNRIVYVDDLAEGIYLVTLREKNKISSQKIIVER